MCDNTFSRFPSACYTEACCIWVQEPSEESEAAAAVPFSPLVSPGSYIRNILHCLNQLGIPKDLHLYILSKNPSMVEIMNSAVLQRLKNGIERGCLAAYASQTPSFLRTVVLDRLYANTLDRLKILMQKVTSHKNFYKGEEMASVFDSERLEEQFGRYIGENIHARLGFREN